MQRNLIFYHLFCLLTEFAEASNGVSLSPVDAKFNYSKMADKKSSIAIFDFQSLEVATNNFAESNILGESGSRFVYRACFDEHLKAAVKKADSSADREFEVRILLLFILQSLFPGNDDFSLY